MKNLLGVSGLSHRLIALKLRPATEELARFRARAQIAQIKAMSDNGGDASALPPLWRDCGDRGGAALSPTPSR